MRIGGIYWCATIWAEAMSTLIAARGDLDVNLGSTGSQNESSDGRLHVDSIGGPREGLTIGTVTNSDCVGVDFGFEADLSAMAMTFDFHGRPLSLRPWQAGSGHAQYVLNDDRRVGTRVQLSVNQQEREAVHQRP